MNRKIIFILICALTVGLFSCQDQTDVYEEFVISGGKTYPGQVGYAMAFSGKNRIKIIAKKPVDPSVTEVRVFWNLYADSISKVIDASDDVMEIMLNDIPENNYSFIIRTYDSKGNVSVPWGFFGTVYGTNYEKRISNRAIDNALLNNSGALTIKFGDADVSNGAIATRIAYTNLNDEEVVTEIPVSESSVTIENYKSGAKYLTVFLPDASSIDRFETAYASVGNILIDYSDWNVTDFSTEHNSGDNGVKNFIDGTWETRWHSKAGVSSYPHHATVDMGIVKTINKFALARTTYDSPGGDSRGSDVFKIMYSLDGQEWSEFAAWDFDRNTNGWQYFPLESAIEARYFTYVALEGPENNHVMGAIIAYGQ